MGFELQSVNDHLLALRMAEYCLRIYRLHRRFPEQYVLYVGNAKLRMPSHLDGPTFHCHYKIIDIRDIAEESLLHSPHTGDHILAILANHPDGNQTIRRILEKLATLEGTTRKAAFQELLYSPACAGSAKQCARKQNECPFARVDKRLEKLSPAAIEKISLRLFDAKTLADLFTR